MENLPGTGHPAMAIHGHPWPTRQAPERWRTSQAFARCIAPSGHRGVANVGGGHRAMGGEFVCSVDVKSD